MRKHGVSILALSLALSSMLSVGAYAADYNFDGVGSPDYYKSSSYEDVYGSQYNYGGRNIVDYKIPEPEYGVLSTTQTGIMEKAVLPGLQQYVGGEANGGYGITAGTIGVLPELPSATTQTPSTGNGSNFTVVTPKKAFTKLTESFKLSNGAIGKISIPTIGIKNYYLWEGETSSSMSKGLGHFTSTSVWDGNVCVCGHNRGATYSIGAIKDLKLGDKITYTTSAGTRTYTVETVATIRNDDWSYISDTSDNRITLITCVAGDSSQRWVVQAVQTG